MSNPSAGRPRGPPSGASAGSGGRPPLLTVNGGNQNSGSSMSRAEKFEDEKRRIIESAFSKKEADGSVSESYITHIRILEDSEYPSTPPPPQSPTQNKKPRVIVIAVRKSGRVRMHKVRENNNGSFSIGKTWVLDDLTAIQSYTNLVPSSNEEQQAKEYAGGIGFVVTIQKPYYWQASTPKEKDFFIFSLIKIYKKYTAGKLPQLYGFEASELKQLGGSPAPPTRPSPAAPNGFAGPRTPAIGIANGSPSPDPSQLGGERALLTPQLDNMRDSNRGPRERPSQERPFIPNGVPRSRPSQEQSLRSGSETRSRPSQEGSSQHERETQSGPSQERVLRTTDSDDRMPYVPGSFPTSDFVRNLKPQTSQNQMNGQRSDSPSGSSAHSGVSVQPQSNLRKLAGAQSTESFRNTSESQSSRYASSQQPSEERARQPGPFPGANRSDSSEAQRPIVPNNPRLPSNLQNGISRDGITRDQVPQTQRPPPTSDPASNTNQNNSGSVASRPNLPPILSPGNRKNDLQAPSGPNDRTGADADYSKMDKQPQSTYVNGKRMHDSSEQSQPKNNFSLSLGVDKTQTPKGTPPTSSPPTPTPEQPTDMEVHRPGLGPMIKNKKSNKEIAATFRKAATSYNAFKPRAGGAAEKMQNAKDGSSNEPDGITGVVPAPSLLRGATQDQVKSPGPDQAMIEPPSTSMPPRPTNQPHSPEPPLAMSQPISPRKTREVPAVRISTPPSKHLSAPEAPPEEKVEIPPATPEKDERRRKRKSDHSAKYARALGIHPSLLEGRTYEIESVLNDFGWGEESEEHNTFEELQSGISKELARVEAGSWLGAIENNDDRIAAVGEMMDRVIAECEEFDCLLTLYNVELGTLSEDVAYIEAQSQGLQVQTANQKLLQTELKTLLDTISISASELKVLKDASLTKSQGIESVEKTLTQLYTAMVTIDPRLRPTGQRTGTPEQIKPDRRTSGGGFSGSELSSMRAVRDKKEGYRTESVEFIQRLKQYLSVKFREMEAETLDALEANRRGSMSRDTTKLDFKLREKPRKDLWVYSPLLLFSREIEPIEWEDMMRMYESSAKKPYQDEFRDNIFAWKRITRKPAGDEQDLLFTSQEKETESIVGRKLTVKRSKTVRADGSNRLPSNEKVQDGKVNAYEAFAGALYEMTGSMFVEQNCIVNLFHISSLENTDFLDAVGIALEARTSGDLIQKRLFDPDRAMAKKVFVIMEEVFTFWPSDLQNMADWVIKQDSLQCVGVLLSLESKLSELEESNQEFLTTTMSRIHDRLVSMFKRFIDEQIRGIEDTKVKIKKRKGVIAFMKTFPNFSTALENMIPPSPIVNTLPIRTLLNDAYQRINKAMFESLKFIAKESPSAGLGTQTQPNTGDLEDKEALNYHILLIENMNYYMEEVIVRSNPVLDDWKSRAAAEMAEHMDLYISSVIRRPLGKLLDFVESTESLLTNLPAGENATAIASRASHSRSVFKKILAGYDSKEIRRGIETLKKRVEKHFGDATDDVGGNRALVAKVTKECEARYLSINDRVQKVVADVYEGSLEVEWRKEDVTGAFRR